MALPAPGTYPATVNGQVVIYESEKKGSLCAAIPVKLIDSDPPWSGRFTCALVAADGTVYERTVNNLKGIFGWDGQDPFWLMDQDFGESVFDAVVEHEPYTPEDGETRMTLKIKYLNKTGEGGGMPEAGDRKSLLAKFGSKLRAVSTAAGRSKPATTAKPKPAAAAEPAQPEQPELGEAEAEAPPEPPKKSAGPPAKAKTPPTRTSPAGVAATSTMEECWGSLVAARPDDTEDALGDVFYATIEKHFKGKGAADLSLQNWGVLKVEFDGMKK